MGAVFKDVVEVIYGKVHKYEIVKKAGGLLASTSFSIYRDGKYFGGSYASLKSAVDAVKKAG